eukprot:1244685-Alexandrium_andersonii.AAC.1
MLATEDTGVNGNGTRVLSTAKGVEGSADGDSKMLDTEDVKKKPMAESDEHRSYGDRLSTTEGDEVSAYSNCLRP